MAAWKIFLPLVWCLPQAEPRAVLVVQPGGGDWADWAFHVVSRATAAQSSQALITPVWPQPGASDELQRLIIYLHSSCREIPCLCASRLWVCS